MNPSLNVIKYILYIAMYEKFSIPEALQSVSLQYPRVLKNEEMFSWFSRKLRENLEMMDIFMELKAFAENHPNFRTDGANSGESLFDETLKPINIGENVYFRSLSLESIENFIMNKYLLRSIRTNLEKDLDSTGDHFFKTSINSIIQSENSLGINLKSADNGILDTFFIPFYSTPSTFVTFLSENDEQVFHFLHELILYFLSLEDIELMQEPIHDDVVQKISLDQFGTSAQKNIPNIQNVIVLSIQSTFMREFICEKKYWGVSFILYVLEFYKPIILEFLVKNNLLVSDYDISSTIFKI